MLKALELVGFKSFADKTRFEFPPGITVIVGPNGSGKSNIVDGMKWVLGEQSIKSLRGKEMADVIFKGSSEGGRRPLNSAEVTIIFDNAEKRLPIDSPEVHVARRVFRSGEGEYLINGQACRLKDIRDLFRGTGVGVDAYSLIEQGKVDRMLQASPKDRRAMFEEAAGVSRFKAKKVEAQRRLERVEQNLLRLSDIVEEVGNRVRAVRTQAAKARRYREYSQRLQSLRTQVGLADWWKLSRELADLEADQAVVVGSLAECSAAVAAAEADLMQFDVGLTSAVESQRATDQRLARIREAIVARSAAGQQFQRRREELVAALHHDRQQLGLLSERAGDLRTRRAQAAGDLESARQDEQSARGRTAQDAAYAAALSQELNLLRERGEQARQAYLATVKQAADWTQRLSRSESEHAALEATLARCQSRAAELRQAMLAARDEATAAASAAASVAEEVDQLTAVLAAAERRLAEQQAALETARDRLGQLRQRLGTLGERAAILRELEQNREGLTDGVREVLQSAAAGDEPIYQAVQGLVADLLHVAVDVAPLIDVALGERSQFLVLSDGDLLAELEAGSRRIGGRVGFLLLDEATQPLNVDLHRHPGVLHRADRLVGAPPRFAALVHRLLSDTWIVESLSIGLALARTSGRRQRFVTSQGELIERDGAVVIGPRSAALGLVSRRSELRALEAELEQLQAAIAATEAAWEQSRAAARAQADAVESLREEQQAARARHAAAQLASQATQQRAELLVAEFEHVSADANAANDRLQAMASELAEGRRQHSVASGKSIECERLVRACEDERQQLEPRYAAAAAAAAEAQLELAKAEQQVKLLEEATRQFDRDQEDRLRTLAEFQAQISGRQRQLAASECEELTNTAVLADGFLELAAAQTAAEQAQRERDELTRRRATIGQHLGKRRGEAQELDSRRQQLELRVGELRHQQASLADRLKEDYGIDLAAGDQQVSAEEQQQREETETEIADLRRKLNGIGPVNMDALIELDALEARFATLETQFNDLTQAKEALERIIQKINADSRRLFEETLEAIRANFQVLYRKAFGGGKADIVLEEGVDPLEAGVDIIATPPGKPSFNNSLLSGGEKALTAVSLLLAIFQFRPSPFCVLDEVDAPFDEANIGRFVDVLKGFLGWTKFIIVTHSKKTMTAATTLYGVTMQESGVSKRVSVQFEDVSHDGHIHQAAIDRTNAAEPRKAA